MRGFLMKASSTLRYNKRLDRWPCTQTVKAQSGLLSSHVHGEKSNIVLMGSPGSGKTSVGRFLARRLGWPLVDVDDDYLEPHWGMTVSQKLAEVGSDEFVSAEGKAVMNLDVRDTIISLSGSTPLHAQAMHHVAKSGFVVFLDVEHRDIVERLHIMKVDRIIGQSPGVSMLSLLKYRQQFYEELYDIRIICERFAKPEAIGEKVFEALKEYKNPSRYISTRCSYEEKSKQELNSQAFPDFSDAILQGLATDGGLYVPNKWPPCFTKEEWTRIQYCTYKERALRILERCIHPLDLHPSTLSHFIQRAYCSENFQDERIIPVSHLQDNQYIIEMFHGPTASFKDAALQLMPQLFSHAVLKKDEKVRYLILVATSGDTGSAVLDGFSKYAGESGTLVMVLYPEHGISEVQKLLMTSADGDNVHVVGIDSDFDFCQSAIKGIFSDSALNADLLANHNIRLSAANSINWGRLLPQVVYHASAYLDLVQQGVISMGDECDLCVPTGNFGNILGAIYAKMMGIPFRKLVCASNENNVLTEFIQTGCYDLRNRHLHVTMAPAIDILKSSNLERFLFLLTDGSGVEVGKYYEQLAKEKYFKVSPRVLDKMQNGYGLIGDYCRESDYASLIRKTLHRTGYLMDPHTAVAKAIADRIRPRERPLLLCSTAHYAKFPTDVLKSLGHSPSLVDHPLRSLDALERVPLRPTKHQVLRASLEKPMLHHRLLAPSQEDIVKEIRNFVTGVE